MNSDWFNVSFTFGEWFLLRGFIKCHPILIQFDRMIAPYWTDPIFHPNFTMFIQTGPMYLPTRSNDLLEFY